MDTRLATKQIKAQQWATIIKDRIESGLKVTEYCDLHNISKTQYYYWLRAIREHCIETQIPQLVELQPPEEAPHKDEQTVSNDFNIEMVIKIGNTSLGINSSTPTSLIKKVAEVFSNA